MDELELPPRLFADKQEPVGDRVNNYFTLTTLKVVMKALSKAELDTIRPFFGKLLDVYFKPSFSGKLSHFLLSRQLDVSNRHETWVIFGGKPIRFSLREFKIVTGLDCSPLPELDPSILKAPPGVVPYWFTLFGGEENITGEVLTGFLKKHSSLTEERRIKYACLLLVHGLLCRKSFHMKIPKEHVELIRDLPKFLNYPWGRYAFDLTMQCIRSRTVSQLAQSTVAIQGFIHALQLVVLEAVPASAAAVGDGTDGESGDEGNRTTCSLKLDKLWEIEEDDDVDVVPIIPPPRSEEDLGDLSWVDDDVPDPKVEYMLQLIGQGKKFSRSMFSGGLTGYAIAPEAVTKVTSKRKRRREAKPSPVSKAVAEPSRRKKEKVSKGRPKVVVENKSDRLNEKKKADTDLDIKAAILDANAVLYAQIKCDMKDMEARITSDMTRNIGVYVEECLQAKALVGKVLSDVNAGEGVCSKAKRPAAAVRSKKCVKSVAPVTLPADEAFSDDEALGDSVSGDSLGEKSNKSVSDSDGGSQQHSSPAKVSGDSDGSVASSENGNVSQAKDSKGSPTKNHTTKTKEMKLVDDNQAESALDGGVASVGDGNVSSPGALIDSSKNNGFIRNKKLKTIAANSVPNKRLCFGPGMDIFTEDLLNIPLIIPPHRPQIMDACVVVLRESLFSHFDSSLHPRVDVLPCSFLRSLAELYTKFKKVTHKDKFLFDPTLIKSIRARFRQMGKHWVKDIDFLYFPFNIDRNRWVGVMVDLLSSTLTVFDSTANVSRATRLKPDFDFICEMLPFFIRKASLNGKMKAFPTKPLSFYRDTSVEQASDRCNSGILSLLFIQAHATGGHPQLYSVRESGIQGSSEQLAVEMYEYLHGDIY